MKKIFFLFFFLTSAVFSLAQNKTTSTEKPKLVIGMVVDQMRWDFLYRYSNRYTPNGFKRLLSEGFRCENTFIPYQQTVTACGHSSVYTGSVPAVNGIVGNSWYERETGKTMYCVQDTSVKTVGSTTLGVGEMSPKNLLVTTITDELRLATNFHNKTIGIALKDRGAILPAGHTANAAYWYDSNTGNWVTSTFYMNELPEWVKKFNERKLPEQYYKQNWNTLFALNTYTQSTADDKSYEGLMATAKSSTFPHNLTDYIGSNYGEIATTPYGNTMTFEMAKAALESEKLGQSGNTDFLALSFSSTDYVGHRFGPNSVETEDTYLRLDKDLADFFTYLDAKIGKGQYLFFITADHGVSHTPGFLQENKLPGGWITDIRKSFATAIEAQFGLKNVLLAEDNNQIYLNKNLVLQSGKSWTEVKNFVIDLCKKHPAIANAYDLELAGSAAVPLTIREMVINGFHPKRGGDIQLIMNSGYVFGGGRNLAATHGNWYPYDAHIPLIFMGWHVKSGKTHQNTYMSDIAPTIAALLNIQMPSGTVGKVITQITD
jgi:predicted AlkP superfamily pyrophosphatase or phosphodiesterase